MIGGSLTMLLLVDSKSTPVNKIRSELGGNSEHDAIHFRG